MCCFCVLHLCMDVYVLVDGTYSKSVIFRSLGDLKVV